MNKNCSYVPVLSSWAMRFARSLTKLTGAALMVAALIAVPRAQAVPYASALSNTNNAGIISFRLNEAAGFVSVIFTNLSGNTVISNLGPRSVGITITNLFVPGNFTVAVTNLATPGYVSGISQQISNDNTNGTAATGGISTNTLRFWAPRGVAINKNPASPYFGRIYVANGTDGLITNTVGGVFQSRVTADGLYVLNPDYSDTFNQGTNPLTAGLKTLFTNYVGIDAGSDSGNSPFHVDVGEDNNLYVSDFSTNSGGMYVIDPNVTTGTSILVGRGITNGPNSAPSPNHGRIGSSIIAKGSLANGNLVLYAIDSDVPGPDGLVNHIKKWNIGAGPLPVDLVVTNQESGNLPILVNAVGLVVDLAQGPDGKFYMAQNRSDGLTSAGIFVVDPLNGDTGTMFSAGGDGLWDEVYDSRFDSIANAGASTADWLAQTRSVAISPDGKYMGVVRDDSQAWIVKLVNGIPDLTTRRFITTVGPLVTGRDICFDAAGNFYTVSGGTDILRAYSPGYLSIAQTSSQGAFTVTNVIPATTVSISAPDPSAAEPGGLGGDTGTITFSRDGDTTLPLTVNYVISGTATRGLDYVTNGAGGAIPVISNSVVIPAGASSYNITIDVIDDSIPEITETVIFTLASSTNYLLSNVASSLAATNFIADDGDLPIVSITPRGLGSYELIPYRPAKFLLSFPPPAFNQDIAVVCALSGTAVAGIDYTNFAFVTNIIPAGGSNVIATVTPIDNAVIAPDKTIIMTVVGGVNYVTNILAFSATNILRNDDLSTVNINTLYTESFDSDHSANWLIKSNCTDNICDFFFDYSTLGIPSAPHSAGGTTRGLRMKAHTSVSSGTVEGISVSPIIAQGFTGDYRLRFDLWYNVNGPLDGLNVASTAGVVGSTELVFAGVGGTTTGTNGPFGTPSGNCVYFGYDGEGGQAAGAGFRDFNAYTNGLTAASQAPLDPSITSVDVWPAGTTSAARDNATAYYAEFGDLQAPPAQISVIPAQIRTNSPGMMGMCWHDVIITKTSTNVTWTVDGLLFCTVITTNFNSLMSTNIFFGTADPNTSSLADNQNALFGLVDNIRVEQGIAANALLSNLIITPGTLTPAFISATTNYAATNTFASNPVTVTATAADAGATLQLSWNGGAFGPLTSGVASAPQSLNLIPPTNSFAVKVTAADTVTTLTYTGNIRLQPSLTIPGLTNSFNGSALALTWATDHTGYRLLTQTNTLSIGLSTNWVAVPGADATNKVTVPVGPGSPSVFYRLVYP